MLDELGAWRLGCLAVQTLGAVQRLALVSRWGKAVLDRVALNENLGVDDIDGHGIARFDVQGFEIAFRH